MIRSRARADRRAPGEVVKNVEAGGCGEGEDDLRGVTTAAGRSGRSESSVLFACAFLFPELVVAAHSFLLPSSTVAAHAVGARRACGRRGGAEAVWSSRKKVHRDDPLVGHWTARAGADRQTGRTGAGPPGTDHPLEVEEWAPANGLVEGRRIGVGAELVRREWWWIGCAGPRSRCVGFLSSRFLGLVQQRAARPGQASRAAH
jgi:hypothetical protein